MIAGLGLGRLTDLRAAEEIRSGRLRPILQTFQPQDAVPVYAAYKPGTLIPPKIRIFLDWPARIDE